MFLLLTGLVLLFAVVNSASLAALLLILVKNSVDPLWKKFIYVFPSLITLLVIVYGGYTLYISFKQPADPNIGLGIVIAFGFPFCAASLVLSGFTHYLIAKGN